MTNLDYDFRIIIQTDEAYLPRFWLCIIFDGGLIESQRVEVLCNQDDRLDRLVLFVPGIGIQAVNVRRLAAFAM